MTKTSSKSSHGVALLLVLGFGCGLALMLVFEPRLLNPSPVATEVTADPAGAPDDMQSPSPKAASQAALRQSIDRLTSASSPGERMQAARWLAEQFWKNQSGVLDSLGESLTGDADPVVRATAAAAFGRIAREARERHSQSIKDEQRIAALLNQQFEREGNDSTRRAIVSAAGELDCSQAAAVIDAGLKDRDPSVKEEALRSRVERERRIRLKKLG